MARTVKSCPWTEKYEEEVYLRGYNDGKFGRPQQVFYKPSLKRDNIIKALTLYPEGLPASDLMRELKISKGTFYTQVNILLNENLISKSGRNEIPVIYKLIKKTV